MKIRMAYAEQRKVRIPQVVSGEMLADPWKFMYIIMCVVVPNLLKSCCVHSCE
jgi:hypothetical protein